MKSSHMKSDPDPLPHISVECLPSQNQCYGEAEWGQNIERVPLDSGDTVMMSFPAEGA